jgi:hypothetical protein
MLGRQSSSKMAAHESRSAGKQNFHSQ